jgi:hypothetical protein
MKGLNDSEGDEISNFELRRMMIRMINDMKEDMDKVFIEIKGNINKHLNSFKENTNK